jgi:hypothetical protein
MSELRISERTVRPEDCPRCGAAFGHVTGCVHDDQGAHAAYFAACHRHAEPEAQINVVLGTWGTADAVDHVATSCLLRAGGAMIVDATVATDTDDPIIGHKLDRDEALAHPSLEAFWRVIDLLATGDPTIARHLDGEGRRPNAP